MAYRAKGSLEPLRRLPGENEPLAGTRHEGDEATGVVDVVKKITPEGTRIVIVTRNNT